MGVQKWQWKSHGCTWAMTWGVKNVWGEENVPNNAPSWKFLDPSKELAYNLIRWATFRIQMSKSRGKDEELRQEKAKMRKKTEHWNMNLSPPHQVSFFLLGHFLLWHGRKLKFWPFFGLLIEVTVVKLLQVVIRYKLLQVVIRYCDDPVRISFPWFYRHFSSRRKEGSTA